MEEQRIEEKPEVKAEPEEVSIKSLLAAGAHFGHQTSRWNPRMAKYIFTARNGIHIIDLEQTATLLNKAGDFIRDLVSKGEDIIFVGTKKQAKESVEEEARRCGMPYVNQRWLGGMLTNFDTIQSRIDYLVRLEDQKARGQFEVLPKKEALKLSKEIDRLNRQMGGFKEMTKFPGAVFIIDPAKERIAVTEARRMGVPIVAAVDTNCNPDEIDYPIPANDDAVRAVRLICSYMASAVLEGRQARELAAMVYEEDTVKEVMTFTPEGGFGTASEMAAASKAAEEEAAAKAAEAETEPAQQVNPVETEAKQEDNTTAS
ncbi:MAG: 30S ribosomal protein S2 [Dehalococcoidia bacterium]|jgi:small subunit ribosomal protein S2